MQATDFRAILRTLSEYKVEFIVVGGVSAVLHGAPVSTFDLDIVHAREPKNLERLLAALSAMDAHYRMQSEQPRRPDASHLSSPGHQLPMTRHGPLDVLGSIGQSRDYADLVKDAKEIEIGTDLRIRVLSLERLIAVKLEVSQEKDLSMLPILQRTLAEKNRG
jgi:predicted nucleotidyltransferase